ncbi:DUF6759 domain-containing protein [Chryseobacterium sp.]|uniref:DUF6759 domain-containing protein n=1 Tax=Chryseobacterium sp. TaxID=1871047 RepID=UPI0011CC84CD|nr:DUF6759 domain-containing protein [Chryseobacterium sp.]TXF77205.1 hypothetical protein FUA25_04505 [Chryseobacterium sp.]
MKNTMLTWSLLLLLGSCKTESAAKFSIMDSRDEKKVEQYIRNHPGDKNLPFLKQKLQALKNAKKPKKRPGELPKPIVFKTITEREAKEYAQILEESKALHSKNTVKVLNQLFNSDQSNTDAILLVQNNSDCNMILRIQGSKYYNLAVPSHGENSIVIPQGDYMLSTNLCDLSYVSNKKITKNVVVALKPNVPTGYPKAESN